MESIAATSSMGRQPMAGEMGTRTCFRFSSRLSRSRGWSRNIDGKIGVSRRKRFSWLFVAVDSFVLLLGGASWLDI